MPTSERTPPDLKRMLAEVCAQYNVRIDPDDPAVAVVALNRLAMESALTKASEEIRAAASQMQTAHEWLQIRAGAMLAQELRTAIRSLNSGADQSPAKPVSTQPKSGSADRIARCMLLGAVLAAMVFGSGVWLGTLIR